MRFVLFSYPDPDYAARWEEMSERERGEPISQHIAWFERYRDRIQGGADLAWPKVIRTVRRRAGQPVTTDGPFVEGKELLGGVIMIEVDGWETRHGDGRGVAIPAPGPGRRRPGGGRHRALSRRGASTLESGHRCLPRRRGELRPSPRSRRGLTLRRTSPRG